MNFLLHRRHVKAFPSTLFVTSFGSFGWWFSSSIYFYIFIRLLIYSAPDIAPLLSLLEPFEREHFACLEQFFSFWCFRWGERERTPFISPSTELHTGHTNQCRLQFSGHLTERPLRLEEFAAECSRRNNLKWISLKNFQWLCTINFKVKLKTRTMIMGRWPEMSRLRQAMNHGHEI